MKQTVRPFQHIRYEYEQRHIYYLPDAVIQRLESPKPAYLLGTRGTGKTTLLKALEWRERLYNSSLRRQLAGDPFSNRAVGVYLKLPQFHLEAFEKNFPRLFENAHEVLLGLYLDIIGLQPLCVALSELAAENVLTFSPEEEFKCIKKAFESFEFLKNEHRTVEPTLLSFKNELFRVQRELEMCALHGKALKDEVLSGVAAVGELGREIGDLFGKLCNNSCEDNPWHFKICLDEAEALGPNGRRVLNTIVRSSKEPLIHVAAFVGVPDLLVQTCLPNLSLAEEDRALIELNQMTDKDFVQLAEGVATARLQEACGDETCVVALDKILGKLDLPALALTIAKESVNPNARKWKALAEQDDKLDILSVFFTEELKMAGDTNVYAQWEKRRKDSGGKRKLMVAAYLGFCKKLSAAPRYAYAEMVVQMSDHCIRDFLRMLNEIYLKVDTDPRSFCERMVPLKAQDAAIKKASRLKIDGLHQSGVNDPVVAHRLIDALAILTSDLQSTGRNQANYRSPERGRFIFDIDGVPSEDISWLMELLIDSAEAGFLFLIQYGPRTWEFRIHASLAAAYGFSYRGAYYQTKVDPADLIRLAKSEDHKMCHDLVKTLSSKLTANEPSNQIIFNFGDNEN